MTIRERLRVLPQRIENLLGAGPRGWCRFVVPPHERLPGDEELDARNATPEQRANWRGTGAGYGIHWPMTLEY